MIIKRYDGSAFQELFPKTISQRLFANNGTTPLFNGDGKIDVQFLPDSVFDSLYFYGTVSTNSDIRNLGIEAVDDAEGNERSPKGYYWVATAPCTISSGTGAITVGPYTATTSGINPSEEGVSSGISVALETGDWFILISITGAGTSGSPFSFSFATVNNTYETAKAAVHGIVKLASDTQQSTAAQGVTNTAARTYGIQNNAAGQLVVNVPWQNTVFTHPAFTAIDANATDNGINVIDSISVNTQGHVTAVGLRNLSAATASVPGHMTAAFAAKLDGIAANANNFAHPTQVAIDANAVDNGVSVIDRVVVNTLGHVTSVATRNLSEVTTTTAGVMGFADKVKLNGIAPGATANTGTVTSVATANGTGITVTGGPITTSGTLTITNTLPNATHTGEVTGSGVLTIANNAVTNVKLADMPGFRIKGKNTTGTGDPLDLTTAQTRTLTDTVALFFQSTAPTAHADGTALQAGTLWLHI